MSNSKKNISSGLNGLNRMLNGLFIGDNVVWHDDVGSLASQFCIQFIRQSIKENKSIVYVSFDRSPKNLIEKLGSLAKNKQLTILDCFTNGKGDKAQIFNRFYEKDGAQWPYQVIKVTKPEVPQAVSDAIYGLHKTLTGDVRFVFESLTGMADLWEGEDQILKFYSHTCPQLYELDTIAYWILEKGAHSSKLKAHINQIAQVAIDLSIEQGKSKISILKTENRSSKFIGKSVYYTCDGNDLVLDGKQTTDELYDIGSAIKKFRKSQGMPQKELSRLVGVTPSNISQIESNQVFPSIPALYKIADHLSVDVGSFFLKPALDQKVVFSSTDGTKIHLPNGNKKLIEITQLTPFDHNGKAEVFLIKVFGNSKLTSHFFQHKGEEIGYVLSGKVDMVLQDQTHHLESGEAIYLKMGTPNQWINKAKDAVSLLWIKVK